MIRSKLSSWREYWTPVTDKSTFQITGQINPHEFAEAGNYLTTMFPTWNWNSVSKDISYRDFLPKEKQFLISKKVVCNRRAEESLESNNDGLAREVLIEGNLVSSADDPFCLLGDENTSNTDDPVAGESKNDTIEKETTDIDKMMEGLELNDNNIIEEEDDIVDIDGTDIRKRYYDLYITYSTTYRTPKMYLVGFNNDGSPLTPNQMFEDISPDYRTKTATIENLPFYKTKIPSVSIHPCKHANVMKILFDKIRIAKQNRREKELEKEQKFNEHSTNEDDGWEDLQNVINDSIRADQYLVVFLKFITSVTPTIEHDYTMEGW